MSRTERPPLVLIAEDDADDQLMIRQAFRHVGFEGELEICGDGSELLNRLLSRGARVPSLVLLDMKMPRMGGLEALAEIRKMEGLSSLPIVAFTSSDMPRDLRAAYELGVNAYVCKPLALEGLRRTILAMKQFWLDVAMLPDSTRA